MKRYEQMVRCREFEEAHESVKVGRVLLVCSYDNEEKFSNNRLERAISLQRFRACLTTVLKSEDLIFYCARRAGNSSAGLANDQERR